MQTLRERIAKHLQLIIFILAGVIILLSVSFLLYNSRKTMINESHVVFTQIEQILFDNHQELIQIEAEHSRSCIESAKLVAQMISYNPEALTQADELAGILEIAQVDEIHLFDKSGEIVVSTRSEYLGYTMESGEQISFFAPMLKDKSLQLCQDVMPNTAESRLMQYAAVWSADGEHIVQIGLEPTRVMEVTKKNELSYIFSLLTVGYDTDLYAVDAQTGDIKGSTDYDMVGKNIYRVGFEKDDFKKLERGFSATVKDTSSYCIFTKIDNVLVGRVCTKASLNQSVILYSLIIALCVLVVSAIMLRAMLKSLNYLVIEQISGVNEALEDITKGDLRREVNAKYSKEFKELSTHINEMKKSITLSTDKLSYILDSINGLMGIYEYNINSGGVKFIKNIKKVLSIDSNKKSELAKDYKVFEEYLNQIKANVVYKDELIYGLPGKNRYVKIKQIRVGDEVFGIIMDATEDVIERQRLQEERDVDSLTGLLNRRGLERALDEVFANPREVQYGVLFMIDADGLKSINDVYGHECGDLYLKKVGNILKTAFEGKSIVSRQGGDEYVLMCYGCETSEPLEEVIKKLKRLQNSETMFLPGGQEVNVKFSMGYDFCKLAVPDYHYLMSSADARMYEDKKKRKALQKELEEAKKAEQERLEREEQERLEAERLAAEGASKVKAKPIHNLIKKKKDK